MEKDKEDAEDEHVENEEEEQRVSTHQNMLTMQAHESPPTVSQWTSVSSALSVKVSVGGRKVK